MTDSPGLEGAGMSDDIIPAVVDALWNAFINDPNDPFGLGYVSRETGTLDVNFIDMESVAHAAIDAIRRAGYVVIDGSES